MYREKILELQTWKERLNRKPLILNGARQVGKSWLVKHFGKNYFKGKLIEINLEKNRDLHIIFKKNSDVKRIIFELGLLLNVSFEPGKDLFFIDEIQSCPEALSSLRYFYEELPDLHLIAAGSLLDFEFRNIPFPVGRVEVLDLHPMNFYEFLLARNKKNLAQLLELSLDAIPEEVNSFFEEDFNLYLIVGGMPESVAYFIKTNDLAGVSKIQDDLWYSYQQDFKKFNPKVDS
ncbi:MAG: ATP-binding protein, partial [Flavobacterium sp.]